MEAHNAEPGYAGVNWSLILAMTICLLFWLNVVLAIATFT